MTQSSRKRLHVIDNARGLALIAMTLFHFGWDLEMFGFAERGFASQPAMVWFARCIASSFLFLVGVGLMLAHGQNFRISGFAKRLAVIGAAAAVISVATWVATPEIFIFFGILHHIALASVFGLLFLRLPAFVMLLAAIGVLLAALYGRTDALNAPWWWWSGLNQFVPRSSDYVPIFPFFAAVLAGMAAAKYAVSRNWDEKLARTQGDIEAAPVWSRALGFIGRHSLVYYLVHQPVMIAFLYIIQMLVR